MAVELATFSPEDLERDVQAALLAARVYDIGSYGWLNENDVDPDYIGHAMWQTDQPQIDLNALLGDAPVLRRPEETEKQILTLGEDFCSLMQTSRLSLGLALVWAPHARRDTLNEPKFFWLHHTDAFLKLAIASDRLRDLLVVACTGKFPGVYKRADRRNRLYVTPFNEAGELLAARGLHDSRLTQPVAALPDNALTIFGHIDRRNSIVHSIATRMAKSIHGSVIKLQNEYDRQQLHGFTPRSMDFAEWRPRAEAYSDECRREIDESLKELRDWYHLLIDSSNLVFQVEYWSRTLGPE